MCAAVTSDRRHPSHHLLFRSEVSSQGQGEKLILRTAEVCRRTLISMWQYKACKAVLFRNCVSSMVPFRVTHGQVLTVHTLWRGGTLHWASLILSTHYLQLQATVGTVGTWMRSQASKLLVKHFNNLTRKMNNFVKDSHRPCHYHVSSCLNAHTSW